MATNVVAHFYDELFRRLPAARGLFPADLTVQQDRLLAALLALVDGGVELAPVLEQLGRDHRKFGVRPAQYRAVGEALIATLALFAGPHWTPQVEQSWLARYGAAATVMRHAAEADRDSPPYWYATVVEHELCGRDVAILRLRPHTPYPYTAGQYATLESPRLPRVWRPYSMATAPRLDRPLEFHVRALGHGGLSDVLVASWPGDVVRLGPPRGTVTLTGGGPEWVRLFVAGGTGWSTVKALLGQYTRESHAVAPRLLVSCRPGEPYDPGFGQFVRGVPGVHTAFVHGPADLRAELAPERLPRGLDAYVAGPPGLVDSAARLLDTAGVPSDHIHHDLLVSA